MEDQNFYHTIEKPSVAEFSDRGSKFIGMAYPVNDVVTFKLALAEVKRLHPKASHYCFAYRFGTDGSIYRVADAGEPSGTAGRPILGQIDSKGLTNVLVIVVRYFGGTLLGVPGLINAYKSTASMSLQLTPIIRKPIETIFELQFDYTVSNDVIRVLKKFNCNMVKQDMQLFCDFTIGIAKQNELLCINELEEIRGVVLKKKSDSET